MIARDIHPEFMTVLSEFPVVTVLGPRQAGKTTLVRHALPDFTYVSLENPEIRQIAAEDPKQFLKRYSNHVIFDEVQRVPQLLSYLQGIVDDDPTPGRFVLTGSHQLELSQAISQSLAGRTAVLTLYPLSISELSNAGIAPEDFSETITKGFLPRVYDQNQRPSSAYSSYFRTYVERDVRLLIDLKDATLFEKFLTLLAGRVGQLFDHTSMGNDVGVDGKTIKRWLSILEASFIIFRLTPYSENFSKRVIKSPKFYFIEPGLLAFLLGIETPEQLERDPLVGNIFENLVVLEALKTRTNQGKRPALHFFRDNHGREIDLLFGPPNQLTGVEIKSTSTYNRTFKKGLLHFDENVQKLTKKFLVFNGENMEFSDGVTALNFKNIKSIFD